MTNRQQLRLTYELNLECRTRKIPADLRPQLFASWLTFLNSYSHLLRQNKHRRDCLVAFVQGWLRGSTDIRIDQELGRQQHQGN